MPENIAKQPRSILVSGASIAGPAIAYWLDRYGFDVTVVERAGMIRGGGYLIDVRGTALDVVERMGVLRQLRDEVVDIRKLSFVGSDGRLVAAIEAMELTGGIASREIELPRGALSSILYDLTRNGRIRYRFNDSIDALTDDGTGVDVRFESGAAQRFDIVVGADGIHSNTRALTFGPEPSFNRYLGYCFTGFPMKIGRAHV